MELKIKQIDYLSYIEFEKETIGWNSFFPKVVIFSTKFFKSKILPAVKNKSKISKIKKKKRTMLEKYNIIGYKKEFKTLYLKEMEKYIERKRKFTGNNIEKQKFYSLIHVFNEECNLNCPYCIMKYTWGKFLKNTMNINKERYKVNLNNCLNILEQNYKNKDKKDKFIFSINGGEFLIYPKRLKNLVLFIREYKKDKKATISINTNGTLLDEELVKFFKKHNVIVNISIDLNKKHHDSTRKFKNGQGSFDIILKSISLLKKYGLLKEKSSFQGTIEYFNLLKDNKFKCFYNNGFTFARISPNLINKKEAEGKIIANKYFKVVFNSSKNDFLITDNIFDLFSNVLNGSFIHFAPFCNGLGANDKQSILYYNISRNTCSYVCQYVPTAYLPYDTLLNIYDPLLLETQIQFMNERISAIKNNCMNCPIVGICRGGCVIDGINFNNKINKAGCAYIRELWLLFVKSIKEENHEENFISDY